MEIKFKYELKQHLLVHSGDSTFPDGAIVQVLDRSEDDPETFLVVTLQDLGKCGDDVMKMYQSSSSWVHQDNCAEFSYAKPAKPWWKFW